MNLQILLAGLASLGSLGLYAAAEFGGWSGAGSPKPPIPQQQLRQGNPGSWNYVYWHHGFRGK